MEIITKIEDFKKKLSEIDILKKSIQEDLKKFVRNKDIPLEERWDVFICSELGDKKSYIERFKGIDKDDYYDKFYIEKYQTVYVHHLLDMALEQDYWENPIASSIEFKENVLEKFVFSFKMDW